MRKKMGYRSRKIKFLDQSILQQASKSELMFSALSQKLHSLLVQGRNHVL